MTFLADLVDQSVVLPIWLGVAATLAFLGWLRGAAAWLLAIAATLATTLLLKLAFIDCAPSSVLSGTIENPSGHTAAGVVICSSLTHVLARSRSSAILVALVAWLAFGSIRVLLGDHNVGEVIVGGGVGLGGALLMLHAGGTPPERIEAKWMIAAVVLAVAFVFHGVHFHAEHAIRHLARLLPICRSS